MFSLIQSISFFAGLDLTLGITSLPALIFSNQQRVQILLETITPALPIQFHSDSKMFKLKTNFRTLDFYPFFVILYLLWAKLVVCVFFKQEIAL